jgi:carbonic anhydrase
VTEPTTPLARWLAPLTSVVRSMDLTSVSEDEALKMVVEKNVRVQVENVAQNDVVLAAGDVWVHGWIFELGEGRLKDLEISQGGSEK